MYNNNPQLTAQWNRKTNVWAMTSLLSAFVIPVMGIITGHMALRQLSSTGQDGRGLAVGGIVVGYVVLVLQVVVVIVIAALLGDAADTLSSR